VGTEWGQKENLSIQNKGVNDTKRRKPLIVLVPGTRIELVQPYDRGILSPLRLPIPPPRHLIFEKIYRLYTIMSNTILLFFRVIAGNVMALEEKILMEGRKNGPRSSQETDCHSASEII
jgi:hypothetical protein